MSYESKTGLGVHNQYGPRTASGVSGFEPADGVERKFIWVYDPATLLDDRNVIPAGAVVTGVTKPSTVTAVTVGGTSVTAATEAAPVKAAGAVAVTGATLGAVVIVKYLHLAEDIVVA